MSDEELLAAAPGLPIAYYDGFGAYQKINGVLRCIGYDLRAGPLTNLVISLTGANLANAETRRVLDENPTKGIHIWTGTSLAH